MNEHITHVAMDDSKRKIIAGILRPEATEPELRSIPNEPRHLRRFFERLQREGRVVACYEAGPSGYDLYRQLMALDVPCQVIAPALTPRRPGDRIKTDRRDAAKLVRLFRAGALTPIHVPDEASEAVRDFVRCREDAQEDLRRWRHRLPKFLARHGRVYRDGRNWSQRHWAWLRTQRFTLPALDRTAQEYRWTVEQLLARVADLDREIAALAAQAPYREPVGWLRCFRGIDTLAAMTLLVEIGDFQRFRTPRALMAYFGLVPSEAASGDRAQHGSITKVGNTHACTSSSKRAGMPAARRGSASPSPGAARGNPRRSAPRRGGPRSGSTGRTGTSWGTASVPRWPSWRAPASWSGSCGPP